VPVSNHAGYLDNMVMAAALPLKFRAGMRLPGHVRQDQ